MIKELIENRNTQLEALGYFEKVHGLCELKSKGDKTIPLEYIGSGEYKDVKIDFKNGVCYWRLDGDPSYEDDDDSKAISCVGFKSHNIPLRLVCFIPRKKLKIDDSYSGERVVRSIVKGLTGSVSSILPAINAASASAELSEYSLDSKEILTDEYGDPDKKDVPFNFLPISISFNFNFLIDTSCIIEECDE